MVLVLTVLYATMLTVLPPEEQRILAMGSCAAGVRFVAATDAGTKFSSHLHFPLQLYDTIYCREDATAVPAI